MESLSEEKLDPSSDPPIPIPEPTEVVAGVTVLPSFGVNLDTVPLEESACERECCDSFTIEHEPELEPAPAVTNQVEMGLLATVEDGGTCEASGEDVSDQTKLSEETAPCEMENIEEESSENCEADMEDATDVDCESSGKQLAVVGEVDFSVTEDSVPEVGIGSDTFEILTTSNTDAGEKLDGESYGKQTDEIGEKSELTTEFMAEVIDGGIETKEDGPLKKEGNANSEVPLPVEVDEWTESEKKTTTDVGSTYVYRETDEEAGLGTTFSNREIEYENITAEEEEDVKTDESQRLEDTNVSKTEEENRKNEFSTESQILEDTDVALVEEGNEKSEIEFSTESQRLVGTDFAEIEEGNRKPANDCSTESQRLEDTEVAEMEEENRKSENEFSTESQRLKDTDFAEVEEGNRKPENDISTESQRLDDTDVAEIEEANRKSENEFSTEGEDVEMEEKADDLGEMEVMEEQDHLDADEAEDASRSIVGKRKRGKAEGKTNSRASKKKLEEDVCFICFDGGDLVLCDRRGCPKAYHPSCVNHDEAFFQSKGRWNCGWHQCSVCQKSASNFMCFTCSFSLCKVCIKDAVIFVVRGNKGLCETCIRTVMLIERSDQQINDTAQVDFDDKSSWEYLFKDYWMDLKKRLSITSEELSRARNPWKGSDSPTLKPEGSDDFSNANNEGGSDSESSLGNVDMNKTKKKKGKKRLKSGSKSKENRLQQRTSDANVQWASKELLELVIHMRNGDTSVCSQFDVQALLLEYITRNKLRDPRRKSHILCDFRLQNLFGKPRVGHFEMLKLLESHFLLKEDKQADDLQGSVVDTETSQQEIADNSDSLVKTSKDKKRKSSKKGDGRGMQYNVKDFAAIDTHNITLIYLRRSLVEHLLNDAESFNEKVVGAFVRLRIPGSTQKQDLYRLVQVVGTSKTAEPYRVGKKTTDFLLEILNLNKSETVKIDIISNQEFTEDECKRLRQSIKCGLITPLTVGAIHEKAVALQAVRVQDALEAEITRVSHLRDRASDMGRRKELRECVEKLSKLKSNEERQRRLDELPQIHSDPKMDPGYESDDDEDNFDERKQESYMKSRSSSFNRPSAELVSPRTGSRNFLNRNISSKGFYNKANEISNDKSPSWEKPRGVSASYNSTSRSVGIPEMVPKSVQESVEPPPAVSVPSGEKIDESEKMWHYKDPSGKIQGPFSMVQLRKWSTTGYFPSDLKIWRKGHNQDNSVLLSDALNGIFPINSPISATQSTSSTHLPLISADLNRSSSDLLPSPKSTIASSLPSPTPAGSSQGTIKKDRSFKSRWSPTNSDFPSSGELSTPPPATSAPLALDAKSLQSLVHHVAASSPSIGSHNWMASSVSQPEVSVISKVESATSLPQPNPYWGSTTTTTTTTTASSGGTAAAQPPPIGGPPSTSWRGPNNGNQSAPWGTHPGNSNPGWLHPPSAWVPPGQGPSPGNGTGWVQPAMPGWGAQPYGNTYQGWMQPNQAPPMNPSGWMAPGQRPPPPGNANPSPAWSGAAPWSGESDRDRPWTRPPSLNREDPSRLLNKGTRVCKYHESGHCKKGSACDYLHS